LRSPLVSAADGRSVFALVGETWFEFALPEGTAAPVKGIEPEESILSGASDGKHVYVGGQTQSGARLTTVDPETGTRTLLIELPDANLGGVLNADVSPDGQTIVYVTTTARSTLYLITGLR
jgi:dipeptidyl aminopeptidase/acylaminoacyl peptidase